MSKKNPDLKMSLAQAKTVLVKLRRYSFVAFLIFVAGIYGFILLRINVLSTTPPSDGEIINQSANARVPRVDPAVLKQLQSLQDNSVSVKTLFEDTRNNPFQE